MSQVTLARHGQAQTGATDEASYDSLSDLGHRQAGWLGAWLAGSPWPVSQVWAGTLRRQRQTADHVCAALGLKLRVDPRLNEVDYFGLAPSARDKMGWPEPDSREAFLSHMPRVLAAWEAGSISCSGESFAGFSDRVHAVLDAAEAAGDVILVTSGGVIAMAMRHVLNLDSGAFAHLLLQTNNASFHRYQVEFGQRRLMTFNATPHLEQPGRAGALSYL